MKFLILKYAVTAFIIVLVSEVAKRTGIRSSQENRPIGSALSFASLRYDHGDDLALYRRSGRRKDKQSRLLYVLVRHTHIADVSGYAGAIKIWY